MARDVAAYMDGQDARTFGQRVIPATRRVKAAMNATVDTARGIVTVNCPYCLIGPRGDKVGGLANPVDVTRFVEHEGKREHRTTCSKGHTLRFKTIAQWREEQGHGT